MWYASCLKNLTIRNNAPLQTLYLVKIYMAVVHNHKKLTFRFPSRHIKNFLVIVLATTLLSACGGGGGGGTSSVNTGKFIDAPVQGLDYFTATQSGTTDSKGQFKCKTGEQITFSIGDVVLGTTLCKSIITPLDLVSGAADETDPTVTNILRFLQSLDDDCDLDSLIHITPQVVSEVNGRPVIFDTSIENFGAGEVADLFNSLNAQDAFPCGTPRALRSAAEAQEHFRLVMEEFSGQEELNAFFTVDPESVIVLETVIFDASDSTGEIVEYLWDFGDGETSAGVETSHTYSAAGNYLVTLTVIDDNNNEAISSREIVATMPANQPPIASFTATPTTGMAPQLVSFVPTASDPDGTIVQYFWDFGDGVTIKGRAANHTYHEPGTYIATLTVTDNDGAETAVSAEIVITGPPPNQAPTASFTASPETGEAPLTVSFNASGSSDSDGTISTYSWDFGDGMTSSGVTRSHSYSTAGTYLVKLVVTDNDGATAEASTEIIVLPSTNQIPVAAFNFSPPSGGAPLNVNFNATDSSDPDGNISNYNWDFGDGQTGSGSTTSHIFTEPGTYSVTLSVTDDDGASNSTAKEIIVTDIPNQPPTAALGVTPSIGEAPLKITCIGAASSDPDGSIVIYSWDFGDGITATGPRVTHTFTEPGLYTVVLTVTDDDGATDTKDLGVLVNERINDAPTASFTATPQTGEAPLDVVLDGSASNDPDGTITQYAWVFGDGQADNSNTRRPSHTYTTPGNYQVRLTVTDNDGATGTKTVTVNVLEQTNQPPTASFTATPSSGAAPLDVTLDASSSVDPDGTISEYFWDLGDGQTATGASLTYTYTIADSYLVFLTVTDNEGATDTTSMDVTVTAPQKYTVSGTIQAPDNTAVDSDINDPAAPYASNDSEENAQPLPNPVILGGYVNIAGAGPSGRSLSGGDPVDFYLVDIAAGQQITLSIADPFSGDLDLFFINNDTSEIGSSEGTGAIETLTAPSSGSYFIIVHAFSGASNYNLTIGQATPADIIAASEMGSLRLQSEFRPGDIIVRFKEDIKSGGPMSLASRAAATGLRGKGGAPGRPMLLEIDTADKQNVFQVLGINEKRSHMLNKRADVIQQLKIDTIRAIKALRQRHDVLYAEPNYLRRPMAVPNDSYYNLQWHYPLINLPQAWDITTGNSNVIVAVIDTGVLLSHPDLQGQLTPGYDFISDTFGLTNANDGDGIDPNPDDPGDMSNPDGSSSFHGTHVAGTIAARSNNSTGVAGIAWNAKVMPLRTVGAEGGWSFDIMEALRYAAGLSNDSGTLPAQAADIINLSLGGPGWLQSEQDFYDELHDTHNIIAVAAAGNNAESAPFYPGSYNNVVSVSAVDASVSLAYYSNFGTSIDVTAPGGGDTPDLNGDGYYDGVLSTTGDDKGVSIDYVYAFYQGTSMATPHVAGVAALMKSVYGDLTPSEFDSLLSAGTITQDIGSPGRDNLYGHGLIDAYKAVVAAQDLAGGGSEIPPVLVVNPTSINFGSSLTSISLSVQNGGGGTLTVDTPTDNANWLSVIGSGLGTYTASVNRTGLADGIYSAVITFTSSANTVEVNVIMQVESDIIKGDVGRIYILLIDPDTFEAVAGLQDAVDANNGQYNYSIGNVTAGTYHIFAGSDPNNDSFICDTAEACGAYLTLEKPAIITVDSNLSGRNFNIQYNVNVPVQSLADGNSARKLLYIRRITGKILAP
jgi:serine protease